MEATLRHYNDVASGKSKPKFKTANLDAKISDARDMLKHCILCERRCGVDRNTELGWCAVPAKMLVSSMFVHWGEEQFLIPSFTVFFWSCNFSCIYCQNWEISQRIEKPKEIQPQELASAIDDCNCKNVNFVGGEPTPYLPFILETLKHLKTDIPVVWNSNFYMSEESMKLLGDVVDVYLSDFKYGNDGCAQELSRVENYTSVVKRNHILAHMDSDLVIRHLVLPGHIECCSKPILEFISQKLGKDVIVNIMPQYRPEYLARKHKTLNRRVIEKEFSEVVGYASSLGLSILS